MLTVQDSVTKEKCKTDINNDFDKSKLAMMFL